MLNDEYFIFGAKSGYSNEPFIIHHL